MKRHQFAAWVISVNEQLANGGDGAQGPQGPEGPQGEQGETGPQGAPGNTGSQGPQGNPGTNGTNGTQGPQGIQGLTGDTGPQGIQGPQGEQGLPGSGGAGITGAATITLSTARYEHSQTVSKAGITSTSLISVQLAAALDTDENCPEMIDLNSLSAIPGTDQFDVLLTFPTPHGGPIKIQYQAA